MKEVEKEKQEQGRTDEQENTKSAPVSETWAQETIEDLEILLNRRGFISGSEAGVPDLRNRYLTEQIGRHEGKYIRD